MVESKGWQWEMVKEDENSIWKNPCIESYYLLNRWKMAGKMDFLDLGCGLGRHSMLFGRNGFHVRCFDISREALARTRAWAESEGLAFDYADGDMLALPYEKESADCILCRNVISHTDTNGVKRAVSEIGRVLKTGGECYLTLGSKATWQERHREWPQVDENTRLCMDEGPEYEVPHFYADYALVKELMIPITLQTLMLNAVSFGDTLMLGLVSQESLAAVSLASQVSFVMSLFISTLTGGATVLSAQYIGKKDMDTVEGVLALILRDALLVSLIFFGLAECCPQLLMRVFTGEAEMIGIGAEYLRIAGVSYLFSGFSQCFLCMLKVNDRAKTGTFITTGVVFLDLFLNAIFIFGLFGFPAMGARGAALTTVLSKGVELIAVAAYFRASGVVRVKGRKLLRPDFSLEREFWKYSFPIFLNDMAWGGGVTVYSVIIGHLGTDATAANSIVTVVKNLVICISTGMGSASGILVGRVLGENRLSLGKLYGRRLSRFALLCGFFTAFLVLLCGPFITAFFKTGETTRDFLAWMLVFCAANCIARCINDTVICGIFSAGGDTKFDAQSLLVTMWGIIIPVALCAAFWWKLPVVWVYFILSMDEIIKLPWVYAHYKKYGWVKNITRE